MHLETYNITYDGSRYYDNKKIVLSLQDQAKKSELVIDRQEIEFYLDLFGMSMSDLRDNPMFCLAAIDQYLKSNGSKQS